MPKMVDTGDGLHQVLGDALAGKFERPLKCPGVGRDKDNISALQFYFSRRATDDEMRFLHEVMQRAVACMPTSSH